MRTFKLILYLVAVMVFQTVVFSRLSLFGVFPDLFLISVILFAVMQRNAGAAVAFSGAAGLLQDVFSYFGYFNLFAKVIVSGAVIAIRKSFEGEETVLAFGMVAVFVPAQVLAEEIWLFVLSGSVHAPWFIILRMLVALPYNLLLTPLLLAILKRIIREKY